MESRVGQPLAALCLIAASATLAAAEAQEIGPRTAERPAAGGNEAATQEKQQLEKTKYFRERLAELRMGYASGAGKPLKFVGEPLITFENPVSQMWDGYLFVWTDRGRPAAAVKCYYHSLNKRWGRTFVSLAPGRIEMSSGENRLWVPEQAGLVFAELPGGSKPSGDARRRLTQMRDIARRFTMVDHWGLKDPTDWRLRLLTTPLYRYEAPEHEVVDGALFGYVANSPEALVLVEARKSGEALAWYFAVARMTRFEVTVSLDDKEIARFPRLEAWPPSGVYFHDPVEMPDYPFRRDAGGAPDKE